MLLYIIFLFYIAMPGFGGKWEKNSTMSLGIDEEPLTYVSDRVHLERMVKLPQMVRMVRAPRAPGLVKLVNAANSLHDASDAVAGQFSEVRQLRLDCF